ncbi:MAG: DUF805 domain-containing protein [Phycisphaerales bacterium]|nr:DUF805 domain-containing protein [Phycisphaerales bacterium]
MSEPITMNAPITPWAAFKLSWSKYGVFKGRATRSEYWWAVLIGVPCLMPLMVIAFGLAALAYWMDDEIAGIVVFIALYLTVLGAWGIPWGCALAVRRFHDVGKSGWWFFWLYLLSVVPFVGMIGSVLLIVFLCMDSQPGENQYGSNPKGVEAAPPMAKANPVQDQI